MSRHVHFLGICGYAVSGAALIAQQMGYKVTGSDEDAYPPVTDILTNAGINWKNHHDPANLEIGDRPDLVVVGAQVRDDNLEWQTAKKLGINIISEAEFYAELTAQRVRIAICGTHGKTTTAALVAHLLEQCDFSPGFRLGSTSKDFQQTARLGQGAPFVFEGDEYVTAPWDSRPKFLHIHPHIACLTRVELDHPDIYPSLNEYLAPFRILISQLSPNASLIINADDAQCIALTAEAPCPVTTFGETARAQWRFADCYQDIHEQRFTLITPDKKSQAVTMKLPGRHNAANAVAALAVAVHAGADLNQCLAAVSTFQGAARRFEIVDVVNGITVVDDYAHHPTEVAVTVRAARERFSGKVVVIYVPHTYSRTLKLLKDYGQSFVGADRVIIGPIEPARERHLADTVSSEDVAQQIKGVAEVSVVNNVSEAITAALLNMQANDVILCLSVRGFDDVARQTVETLRAAHA